VAAAITYRDVGKTFPDGTVAVRDVSIDVAGGEFVVFVGPSGCGKSTLLRMTAGLERVTAGEIRIGDAVVNGLPPQRRDIAMVFQNYALYPHMSVRRNLEFPLRMAGVAKAERRRRAERVAEMLGLTPLLRRKPAALSGGQRQRVAMGRAIVREPAGFLMDEPLSNLDAKLRVQMRAEIAGLQRDLGVTTIYVTHDQVEAMTLGDRLVVLRDGEIQQVGAPRTVYDEPANAFVAAFIGSPAMNLLRATVTRDGDKPGMTVGDWRLPIPPGRDPGERREVVLGIRPEAIIAADAAAEPWRVRATVERTEVVGHEQLVYLTPPGPTLEGPRDAGSVVARLATADHAVIGPGLAEFGVDATQIHLFAAEPPHTKLTDAP
jgi:multiple sugar transport system ATP-binding protein